MERDGLDLLIADLSPQVQRVLRDFAAAARAAFGEQLRALILFGSAAEGKMRPSSDLNLLVVLSALDQTGMDRIREPLRVAQAAVRLRAMFILEREIPFAIEAFAVKFADILRRRRVLLGADPFAGLSISRGAQIARLRQVLLNSALRLREQYASRSLREEQAARVLAEDAGPLRASAAVLLELEGRPAASPKEALERLGMECGIGAEVFAQISAAREQRPLVPGAAAAALLALGGLAARLHERAMAMR